MGQSTARERSIAKKVSERSTRVLSQTQLEEQDVHSYSCSMRNLRSDLLSEQHYFERKKHEQYVDIKSMKYNDLSFN